MKHLQRLLLLGVLCIAAASGWAATATTTMTVTTTVTPACTIAAAPLNFGTTTNPIPSNIDVTSTLTVTCSSGTPHAVALNVGTGAGATLATRRMTSGAFTMNYSLFTTAARAAVWGDGTAGSVTVSGVGSGAPDPVTVFGRIPPQTVGGTGVYTDTVTATITF
jgi:spore coat protein U-like protein